MFELRVLSGLHLGAALPLFGDAWLIGQADDADLMLSDDGIASHHCRLHHETDMWRLEPACGESLTVECGKAFAVGNIWLCVASSETPWAECMPPAVPEPVEETPQPEMPAAVVVRKSLFSRAIRTMMFSLMLLMTLTVMSWVLQPTVAQTQVASSSRTTLQTASDVRAPLLKMLRERDLASVVTLEDRQKSIRLSGRLNKAQMQIFTRMMSRFNAEYLSEIPLDNQVKPLTVTLPFRIVQITTGTRANIVTDEGQRLFVGDEIDELRLVSITSSQIEFNGRDSIKVNW